MAKVKNLSVVNKSAESVTVSTTPNKTKTLFKRKPKKSAVSKGIKKIKKIYTDKKSGKQHIKYDTDNKGVVYIAHIPHGFYEEQIKDFFKQFGEVTAVNVPRSKSGRARGFAFVQFRHPEVAKVAAEAMNNYLMFNRLLKTTYIPPEQQKSYLFRRAECAILRRRTVKDLAEIRRKQDVKKKVKYLDDKGLKKYRLKVKNKLNSLKKRCADLGVDFACQITGVLDTVKPVSAKKLSESPQSTIKNTGELIRVTALKKTSKSQKPEKKVAQKLIRQKSLGKVSTKIKPSKKVIIPSLKSLSKDKKSVNKVLKKKSLEKSPSKIKPSKNAVISSLKSLTKDKKTADKALKKLQVDKEVSAALKKHICIRPRIVEKRLALKKAQKQVDNTVPPALKKKNSVSTRVVKKKLPQKKTSLEIVPKNIIPSKKAVVSLNSATKLKKSVDKVLKKVDKGVLPALKKKLSIRTQVVKKKLAQKKVDNGVPPALKKKNLVSTRVVKKKLPLKKVRKQV